MLAMAIPAVLLNWRATYNSYQTHNRDRSGGRRSIINDSNNNSCPSNDETCGKNISSVPSDLDLELAGQLLSPLQFATTVPELAVPLHLPTDAAVAAGRQPTDDELLLSEKPPERIRIGERVPDSPSKGTGRQPSSVFL